MDPENPIVPAAPEAASPPPPSPSELPTQNPGGESSAPAGGAEVPPVEVDAEGSAAGDGERKRRRRRRKKRRSGEAATGDGSQPTGSESGSAGEGVADVRVDGRRAEGPRGPREPRPGRKRDKGRDDRHGGKGPHGRERRSHEHSALFAVRALADMAQSLLRIEGVDPFSVPRWVELSVRVPLDDRADARQAAGHVTEQILQRLREVREHERALQPGAVFSYFHESAQVEHCRPQEPRQVFEGYHSTGRPVFGDFVTMAIERKDQGIDQLLAGQDVVLTHVTMGRVLRTQQLAEFGGNSQVYKILGQVDAGLFRVLGAEQKCAFSFQLLRGKTLEGKPRLRLHAVGKVDLMDLADPGVLNILSRFQRQLDGESLRLSGKEKNGEVDDEAFVLPLLQDLAQKLSGHARSTARRTQHAVARSDEGQRPTPRAYPDASEAHDDAILWDTEKGTIVVVGPKGRVHVFTPDARHVTSVVMQGSAIERRRQQSRWRAAEPEERGEFRVRLRQLVASGQDKPSEDAPIALEP